MISNITIENIKGFGTSNNSFNLSIYPKKVNILVAPNGFGKSSITAAFASLKTNRLEVSVDNLHQNDETLTPKLRLTIDGQEYTASPSANELSSIVNVFIVRNRIKSKAISKNMGKFHSVSSSLAIDEIEVIKTIPSKQSFPYSYSNIREGFGANAKVLNNLSGVVNDTNFVIAFGDYAYAFFEILKKRNWIHIEELSNIIKSSKGTTLEIKQLANSADFSFLNNGSYKPVTIFIKSFMPAISDVDLALTIYQLAVCFNVNKTAVKKSINYSRYLKFKDELNHDLALLGATWKDIKAEERDNSLMVYFPPAAAISYGQRDLLTLVIQLKKVDFSINVNKKNILIIDEVFDYLDAVNMTAIQYYLSYYIHKWKSQYALYTIVMTHLSPEYFKNYVFSKKMMNVQYLVQGRALPSNRWRNFLSKRENTSFSEDISKFLLHYNPSFITGHRDDFKYFSLPETWGEGDAFQKELLEQINKYLSNSSDYDPYAVCTVVRIRIEKIVYDQLKPDDRQKFLSIHGTKNKLNFAEGHLEVPDLYYLLGIIYNDAEHVKDAASDKPIIYRLDHTAIKKMIKNLFDPNRLVEMADIH